MRLFFIAFQFLTIIPLPFAVRCDTKDLGRSTAMFPIAGLAIGGILAGINWLLEPLMSRPLCDAILITCLAAVTGALHLDGVADVCDGIAARGSRERFLEVMKDPRVGAVGVVGIVLVLLLKWQALVSIPQDMKYQALLLFPCLARLAQVAVMTGARHARQEGLGTAFIQGMDSLRLPIAIVLSLTPVWILSDIRGMAAVVVILFIATVIRGCFTKRLGGITGDVVGFTSEMAEISVLVLFTIYIPGI